MNKEYVQQYVSLEKEHWWFVARKKIICFFIDRHIQSRGLRVLNIGAAGGASSAWLSKYGSVTSVENEPYFLQYLRSQSTDVVDASVNNLPFADNSFDMVCAFDVLEHVEDDRQALKELERVCSSSGWLIITVPAFQWLWSGHDVVNDHKRRYRRHDLKKLLNEDDALESREISYFNFLLLPPVFIARKFSNLFRGKRNPKSDFENFKTNSFLNRLLKNIFLSEIGLFKWFRLPFGVSLIAVLQKK